jgi:hypothetical protein
MLRRVLDWFGLRTGTTSADEEHSEDADESGFTPSRLDASVLEAHGMGTSAAERELESIEEKAETLESDRPDEHIDHEHGR